MGFMTVEYIDGDTITAIATPVGSGGIGIIRISGDKAAAIANTLFRKDKRYDHAQEQPFEDRFPSHRLNHGYIFDPKNQAIIDEVLLVVMRAPNSYTRENIVEIQSHSGPVILSKILKLVISCGARMAMPGEFTRRAFLNGRIDLSQAEAVGEMISARSDSALKMAVTQLTGHLKDAVSAMLHRINDFQVELEAGLEFGDEISNQEIDYQKIGKLIRDDLITPVEKLLAHYSQGYLLRDGVRLGIAGRPNVGKSSLLNYLIRKDKAIVTPLPGTTRDLIEEQICIDGLPLIITDTAGLHAAEDPVEIIGIEKTRENINQADLVLFLIDGTEPFLEADNLAFQQIGEKKVIVVINKLDLVSDPSCIRISGKYSANPVVFVSARYGQGIDLLKEKIKEVVLGNITIEPGSSIIPTLRQKLALEFALEAFQRVQESINLGAGEELILIDLGLAKEALNEIIGRTFSTDLLDDIFGRFCIGK